MGAALNRIIALPFIFLLLVPAAAFPQAADLVSAEKYFASISASYQKVKDYEALVTITQGKTTSRGKLSYKSPMYLRIDFDDPPKEVLNFDGEKLTFYSPANEVILEQKYKKKTPSQVEAMATSQGLAIMQRNYTIAYLSGPAPVPLEEGSREQVVKLKLTAHGTTSFSQMIVSIKDSLVRRVEGTQSSGDKIVMDFANIRINQGVPDSRFAYDAPPYANVIQDWLFDPEE
jgi:outer membrane lipoprotein-sorting protein